MGPFLAAALPLAKKAAPFLLSALAGRATRGQGNGTSLDDEYRTTMADFAGRGSRLSRVAEQRMVGFNAQNELTEAIRGATNIAREGMREDLQDLAGASVRTGRLNTGFFDEDAGRVVRRVNENLNNVIAQQSLNALQLQQGNDARLAQLGQNADQQYLDLLTGGMDRETANRNASRQRRGNFLTSAMQLGGQFLAGRSGGVSSTVQDYDFPERMSPIQTRR